MAISAHVLARIYGEVQSLPPFENASGVAVLTSTKPYPVAPNAYLPTTGVMIWPLANGVQMGPNNFYVYSVIEVPPAGLNVHPKRFATDKTAAQLATDAT